MRSSIRTRCGCATTSPKTSQRITIGSTMERQPSSTSSGENRLRLEVLRTASELRLRVALGLAAVSVGLFSMSSAPAQAVDLMVGNRPAAGRLGCGETSAPIDFEAARSNSVTKREGPHAEYVL